MAKRIRVAIVQYIIADFDDAGEPIGEELSQPVRVFRVVHPDVWAHGDRLAFPPAAPPSAT